MLPIFWEKVSLIHYVREAGSCHGRFGEEARARQWNLGAKEVTMGYCMPY